jgi:hypothetical protein
MTFSIYRKAGHYVPISKHQNIGENRVELGWLIGWLIMYWGLHFVGSRRRNRKGDRISEGKTDPSATKSKC